MDVMSRPDRAVFRLPAASLFVPALLFFCITPLATAGPWWGVFFAVPAGALVWILVTRTSATATGVTAHRVLGAKRMAWPDLDRLEFTDSRWAIAVGTDGRRLRLPMVRPRDIPLLTSVAGGGLLLGADAPRGGSTGDEGVTAATSADSPSPGAVSPPTDAEPQPVPPGA
jgi:hypothetical protein